MGTLDFSRRDLVSWKNHFKIEIGGNIISYCYIRKNACSAFKNFFSACSRFQNIPGEGTLQFMMRCHRATLEDVRHSDYIICVLRDPVARAISLFQNKFIQQCGNVDIFKNYELITGHDPVQASFREFVEIYLSKPLDSLDPHAHTQASHLMPVKYNAAIIIEELEKEMSNIVGEDISRSFFSKRRNATQIEGNSIFSSDEDLSCIPAETIRQRGTPRGGQLCTPDLAATLREIYAEDCTIIEAYCPT